MPASMAAPTSSTWTCTFQVPRAGAHDGHRVAELRQRAPQAVHGRVGGVEQVLHLVLEPGVAVVVVPQAGGCGRVVLRRAGGDGRGTAAVGQGGPAGDGAGQRVEQDHQPAAAGVDHARLGELRQLLRGARDGLVRGPDGGGDHARPATRRRSPPACSAAATATDRMVPSTGVDDGVPAVARPPRRGRPRSAGPSHRPAAAAASARPRRIWDRMKPELPTAPDGGAGRECRQDAAPRRGRRPTSRQRVDGGRAAS